MDIRLSDVIWLVSAIAMVVAALINQRYESGLRVPWIEDAAQILLAVGLAIVGREALVAGRESRATVSFVAATMIAVAAVIRVVRRVRHDRRTGTGGGDQVEGPR